MPPAGTHMPIRYAFDRTENLLRTEYIGSVPPSELLEWFRQISAHPDFDPNMRQLGDFRRTLPGAWSPEDIREVIRHDPFGPSARRAFVGPSDVIYGLARMYSIHVEIDGQRGVIGVFRTMAEGESWLEQPQVQEA